MERRLFLQAFKRFVCRQVIRFKSTGKMNCTGKNYICRANIDMHTRCNEYTHKKNSTDLRDPFRIRVACYKFTGKKSQPETTDWHEREGKKAYELQILQHE